MTLGRTKTAQSRKAEIAFHADGYEIPKPAINVKARHIPYIDAPEDILQTAWDQTVQEFWDVVKIIAQNHGYSDVFSEGRSNGWLVPFTQRNSHGQLVTHWTGQGPEQGYPIYPDMDDPKERRIFLNFRVAIEGLMRDSCDCYADRVRDLLEDQ